MPLDRVMRVFNAIPVHDLQLQYARFDVMDYLRSRAASELGRLLRPHLMFHQRRWSSSRPPTTEFITSVQVIVDDEEEIKGWVEAQPGGSLFAPPPAESAAVGEDVQKEKP